MSDLPQANLQAQRMIAEAVLDLVRIDSVPTGLAPGLAPIRERTPLGKGLSRPRR